MPIFIYKAKSRTGQTQTGKIEAIDQSAAARSLKTRQLLPFSLKEENSFFKGISSGVAFSRVSSKELTRFTRMLATMISTGLPLVDALENLINQATNSKLKEVLAVILRDVEAGMALSKAFSKYPEAFPVLYTNMVKAGEASGKVDEALVRLADNLEKNEDFRGKVRGALIYPAIVVSAMGGIGVLMLTMVIPKISAVYTEFGAELPLPTKVMIFFSDSLRNFWYLTPLVLLGVFFGFRAFKNNPATRPYYQAMLFKIPIFGKLNQEVTLAIFARTLGSLTASGVGILEALEIVGQTVGDNPYRDSVNRMRKQVEKGFPLSAALANDSRFPQIYSQMAAIGEETGTIDDSLIRLASFFESATEQKVKTLTTAMEPVLILLMGIGVAGLAVAILLPMFNLVNVIK